MLIGGVRYTLQAKGRGIPVPRGQTTPADAIPKQPTSRPPTIRSFSSRATTSRRPASRATTAATTIEIDDTIRIRLTKITESATITLAEDSTINGIKTSGNIFFSKEGNECIATSGQSKIASGLLRITPSDGISTIASIEKSYNRYRGILECRIHDGTFLLINELPLEQYMAGLAEEPDTEPWEKQRAFGIAARTYAAYYMQEKHRKFPGKPYDGSDSPAEFQVYGGVSFEDKNPRWLNAAKDTAHQVLAVDGVIIRPPYFSVSNGRTLSPSEIGWNSFPFAEVFASKPDPWCEGMTQRGHGVGMSGCGAEAQANDGKTAEEILGYYYPGTDIAEIGR